MKLDFPEYVNFVVNNSCALKLNNVDGSYAIYRRDAGNWEVAAHFVGKKLLIKSRHDRDKHLDSMELISTTKQTWRNCNNG